MPKREEALPGRTDKMPVPDVHFVNGARLSPPWPDGLEVADFALGCFWGAERKFWQQPGVYSTAVGYQGGFTPNPTYREVCTGGTGHAEVVRVVFDPKKISYEQLLRALLGVARSDAGDAPGQRHRHAVPQRHLHALAPSSAARRRSSRERLRRASCAAPAHGAITTEIADAPEFYYAEDYHQQYLAKNPNGYCGIGGTGVSCPIGVGVKQRRLGQGA